MKILSKGPVLIVLVLAGQTLADDWPHWRGPNHDGISQETGWWQEGVAHEPNTLWQQEIGVGYASMTVADGRLFAMGNTYLSVPGVRGAGDFHDVLYCLDPNTGEVFWTFDYPSPPYDDRHDGGPCSTPTVADCNVYTLSKDGQVFCLDVNDGTLLWENNLAANYGAVPPRWHFATSPFVTDHWVVYNVGAHGLALSTVDGSLVWTSETKGRMVGHASPVPFEWQGLQLLLMSGDDFVTAVDPQTGEKVWDFPWKGGPAHVPNITNPIVDSNNIYLSEGYNKGAAMYTVTADGAEQQWYQRNMQTFLGSAVFWEGFLYGTNERRNSLTCLDTLDGWVMWNHPGNYVFGSLMLAHGKLITMSDKGELAIVAASPDSYQELGRWSILKGKCWTVPILAHGKIYARSTQGTLVCVQLQPIAGRGLSRR